MPMENTIIAGETLSFTESHSDYKASDGWALTVYLRGQQDIEISGTADGDDFDCTVAYSTTVNWKAGNYWFETYVTKGSERYRVDYGQCVITQGLMGVAGTHDGRSDVKQILDAIEATLLGRATRDQLSYSIAGRTLEKIPIPDLIQLRDKLKAEYESELAAERIDKGLASGKKIKVRFTG